MPRSPAVPRPCSRMASIGSAREARSAGTTPKSSATAIATDAVNASTRQSRCVSRNTVFACVDNCRTSRSLAHRAIAEAGDAAGARQQQALDELLAGEAPARRAERQAHAEFMAARGGAREEQVGDVRARNQQHERDDRHDGQNRLPIPAAHRRGAAGGRLHAERRREVARLRASARTLVGIVASRICGWTPRSACSADATV